MPNLKLTVAYEGSGFFGWQETSEGPSIEGHLRRALEQILRHRVKLQAASRTDAGVHASGQVVNVRSEKVCDLGKLRHGCNALLPKAIVVRDIEKVPEDFHPTLATQAKRYLYRVCTGPVQLPFHRHHSWHVPYTLDLAAMELGAAHFLGTHDFATFCNVRKDLRYKDTVRTLREITLTPHSEGRLTIEVMGDHFLYKMVRNLVGTLVDVGLGKIEPEQIPAILQAGKRPEAGVTAPAHGLTLKEIIY